MGAPVFIVNVTQSPNYPGEINEREFRSIWNQAWFSSLRSASGLYRYARRTGNRELLAKQFDKRTGSVISAEEWFFYGLIGTEMHEVEIDGKSIIGARGGIPIIGEIPTEILIPGIRKNLRIIFLI